MLCSGLGYDMIWYALKYGHFGKLWYDRPKESWVRESRAVRAVGLYPVHDLHLRCLRATLGVGEAWHLEPSVYSGEDTMWDRVPLCVCLGGEGYTEHPGCGGGKVLIWYVWFWYVWYDTIWGVKKSLLVPAELYVYVRMYVMVYETGIGFLIRWKWISFDKKSYVWIWYEKICVNMIWSVQKLSPGSWTLWFDMCSALYVYGFTLTKPNRTKLS